MFFVPPVDYTEPLNASISYTDNHAIDYESIAAPFAKDTIVKDAVEFGIDYKSTANQQVVFQNAINTCAEKKWQLKLSGNITISGPVVLPSNAYIFSESNATLTYNGTAQYCIQSQDAAKNITLKGFQATHKDSNKYCLFKCYRSANVLIEGLNTNMSLVHVISKRETDTYRSVNFRKSDKIVVKNCIARANNITTGIAAVLIEYARNVRVEGNTIYGYRHGIQWWGGNSNHEADGALYNTRKCKNLVIENNEVENVEAGIWGSMGNNVIVRNNEVKHCEDVGIDFEGCFNSVAQDNYVEDTKNGNLATFFLNKNILFANNTVVSNRPDTYAVIKINNSSLNAYDNRTIIFRQNTISFTNAESAGYFYVEPCDNLVLTGNTLNNVALKTITHNQGSFLLDSNNFKFVQKENTAEYCIEISGVYNNRYISIWNNTFSKEENAAIGAISVSSDDFITDNHVSVRTNRFEGFKDVQKPDIYVRQNIDSKGTVKLTVDVTNNNEQPIFKLDKNIEPIKEENN